MPNGRSQIQFCCVTYREMILVTHQTEPENFIETVKTILPLIPNIPGEKKLTFPTQRFQINILVEENGLIFTCITGLTDGQIFPFTFLDAVRTKFRGIPNFLEKASAAHESEFQGDFAPIIAALVFNYNIGEGDKLSVLETQVHDVKKIILNNVDKLIERGEKLEDLVIKSENLSVTSVDFRHNGRTVTGQQKCKNLKMWLLIGSMLATILTIAMLIASGVIQL